METGNIIRIVMVIAGLIILAASVSSLAKRHLRENFCMVWGIVAVMFIVAGIVLNPVYWSKYISTSGTIILLIVAVCVLWSFFVSCVQISLLDRKNLELAMQVSLLNQENESILKRLEELEKFAGVNNIVDNNMDNDMDNNMDNNMNNNMDNNMEK